MAEAADDERRVYEAGAGARLFLSLAFLDPAAVLCQPAGHADPAPDARAVARHHRPHGLRRHLHGPDGAAGRAALPVAALARGVRRHGGPDHAAAGQRGHAHAALLQQARSPTTRSRRSRPAACCSARRWPPCCCAPPGCAPRTASTCGSATSTRTTSTPPCPSPRSAPRSPSAPAAR